MSTVSFFQMASASDGFLGFVSGGFCGGFFGCGLITGGGSLGGGFLGSFCAVAAIVRPVTTAKVNNIFCKTFIAFISSFVYYALGERGKVGRFCQGNLDATNAVMTLSIRF